MESNQEIYRWSTVFYLEKTLQLGCGIFCLCWIEYYSALGKLQFVLYKFRYTTYKLLASINSILFLPRLAIDGQNREEKLKTIFKTLVSIWYCGKCL